MTVVSVATETTRRGEHHLLHDRDGSAERDKPWIIRTYSGHSSARASNELYRSNLGRGRTGLSIAFELPTQCGYDSDDPIARPEVGKVGVPINSLDDFHVLFDAIPIEEMNTSITINGTAMWLLAFHVALARERGVELSALAGTTENDLILVLLFARSDDSRQGIKKGILELADVLAINRADGDHVFEAELAARVLADAIHLLRPATDGWALPVLTCSAREVTGLEALWTQVTAHRAMMERTGALAVKRDRQQVGWMWAAVEDRLLSRLRNEDAVARLVPGLMDHLATGLTTPTLAASAILAAFETSSAPQATVSPG